MSRFKPYCTARLTPNEMLDRAQSFHDLMDGRRSIRHYSADPVPRELIALAIRTASTAPSGAHRQPWRFVAVSDPAIKRRIRIAAEKQERRTYEKRMNDEWRQALEPVGTTWEKPYLEMVPWLVVLFAERHGIDDEGNRQTHYYVTESVSIAAGLFIAAVHQMGLSTLTHTPSPMGFLGEILNRPSHERAMLLFPVGYPADGCLVPDLGRKPLDAVSTWFEPSEPGSR